MVCTYIYTYVSRHRSTEAGAFFRTPCSGRDDPPYANQRDSARGRLHALVRQATGPAPTGKRLEDPAAKGRFLRFMLFIALASERLKCSARVCVIDL